VGSHWCVVEGCALLVQAQGQGPGALVDQANSSALVRMFAQITKSAYICSTEILLSICGTCLSMHLIVSEDYV
jgi:hypothetical protein